MEEKSLTTADKAKQSIQLAINKENFTAISKRIAEIKVTEDNLFEVKDLLTKLEGMVKLVNTKHQEGKAPYWEACKQWDAAKNEVFGLIASIGKPLRQAYTEKCQEVELRRIRQEQETKERQRILGGIETNLLSFSEKIANAKSSKELMSLENQINLEINSKNKYGKFLDVAKERYATLSSIIATQKEKVLALEQAEKEKTTDEQSVLEKEEKIQQLQATVSDGAWKAQEDVVSMVVSSDIQVAEEILPVINPKRSVWKYEVVDLVLTQQEHPEFVTLIPNSTAIKAYMKQCKEGGQEHSVAGIRFYLEKTY